MSKPKTNGSKAPTAAAEVTAAKPRRRSYEGAMVSRLTADWVTSSTSADAEINSSLIRLRNRARQLVRDNAYARQALRAIACNVVGNGIRMQAQVPMQRGSGRLDERLNRQIEAAWERWCRPATCHTAGRLSFVEISRMAITAMAESGEVFLRLVPQPFGGSAVPLALEVLEADLVDEGKSSGPERDGSEWRMGVKVDRWGRPISYAFRTRHPGDLTNGVGYVVTEVPADQIIHLALLERPGQTRGMSWFAAAVKRLHHLAGYEEAEVVRARASSSLMGFIQSPEGELTGDDVYDEERVSNFEPGVFKYLAPGESVQVPQLDAPDGQFEPFLRAMLRAVSGATGVPYPSLSSDYSQTNYSSSRLELLEARENWRSLQQHLIDHLHRPVFERWLTAAVAVGTLPLPGYETNPDRYSSVRWFPRGWGWVDPTKEVEAYKEAVRCGFATQSQIVAELGGDLEELLVARKAEVDRAQELELQFDTNPADDAEGGYMEPTDPAAEMTEDTAEGEAPEDATAEELAIAD
jgi:lambda family phage portal protein